MSLLKKNWKVSPSWLYNCKLTFLLIQHGKEFMNFVWKVPPSWLHHYNCELTFLSNQHGMSLFNIFWKVSLSWLHYYNCELTFLLIQHGNGFIQHILESIAILALQMQVNIFVGSAKTEQAYWRRLNLEEHHLSISILVLKLFKA